ncbi:hypothetical protein BaRGS_00014948 [Batillaria attramentaria]|uniref:IMD domain-containing protein n=1 Tax=Batillaria attramentaria TaxID=370345 RepID=A0ABD0L399_9CAEN
MENAERDCGILGNLFQTIINDLRCSSPVWEDFIYKATKLHQCLKTTLGAISAFLEAFQKVADMATNSKVAAGGNKIHAVWFVWDTTTQHRVLEGGLSVGTGKPGQMTHAHLSCFLFSLLPRDSVGTVDPVWALLGSGNMPVESNPS